MKMSTAFPLIGLVGLTSALGAGCTASPPASSPTAGEGSPEEESPALRPEASMAPSSLRLVEALATKVASKWKTEQAIEDEISLFVRFRLEGKSAAVKAGAQGAYAVVGSEAATTHADVTVDIAHVDADAIAQGDASLFSVKESGNLTIDNPDGFDLFLNYLKK